VAADPRRKDVVSSLFVSRFSWKVVL